jgi:cytochrome P450
MITVLQTTFKQVTDRIKQRTIIHNMAELTQSSSYWDSAEMKSQNMLGVWFAASHQPWSTLTILLLELAARKELQHQLRREIEDYAQLDDFKSLDKLPFLDSFMKEVRTAQVRMNLH